ncbi:PDR/VanB family oxidoreductase [Ralstonia sp. CHL-2022]|uniref:PDR/VanB family oxidoreductase n=1 Tax=Ralstonia mojiangensis TaxID=2953895 RepID=A0AAE3I5D9_9RALS|nr:PDR/VanB family oxidoreductase [Ralstonia mojiangensis]MCT7317472.1 PDR/VanB family oxidoreductase [Ralstonia mojiangensis]
MNSSLPSFLQFITALALAVLTGLAWPRLRNWLRGRSLAQTASSMLTVRVRRIVDETADIKSFELVSADGSALPVWSAGAHIDVRLDPDTVRQYSLCGAPGAQDVYHIAIKNAPDSRGGSRAMHQRVGVGDTLVIGHPRNHFELIDDACHYVLIAAGIGITPLLAMAQELQARGTSYELHYFTRSIAETAFQQMLSAQPYADRVSFHYAVGARLRDVLQLRLCHYSQGHHLYMCGPRRFTSVIDDVIAGIWPSEAVHVEYFGADAAAASAPSHAFEVKLERSKRTIPVAAGCSIADALCAHGISVATSCREGVCGTCLTGLVDGTPDHRDAFLSDKERKAGDKIMICVSRAKSAQLVLDI